MIALVCGGRNYSNREELYSVLEEHAPNCIVHGGADGADRLAGEWAIENRVPEIIVPAQWKGYGKVAGPVRNQWMIQFIKVSRVIAFPGGPGTEDMIKKALRANLPVFRIGAKS